MDPDPKSCSHRRPAGRPVRGDGPAIRRQHRPWISVAFAAALLGSSPPAGADGGIHRLVLTRWTRDQGLPQNTVLTGLQGRDGYLWLGTGAGLVRFDGLEFRLYDRSTSSAFASNLVVSLCEDRDGGLWIGTHGGGMVRFRDGEVVRVAGAGALATAIVWSISQAPDGVVWAGTSAGLFRVDDGVVTDASAEDRPGTQRVQAVLADRGGTVWFGGVEGLFRLDEKGIGPVVDDDGSPLPPVETLAENPAGGVAVGTRGGGLWLVRNGTVVRVVLTDRDLSRSAIGAVHRDRTGALWIGSRSRGLWRMAGGRLEEVEELSQESVWTVFEDDEGNLWVGTDTGGLVRMREGMFATVGTAEGLPSDAVAALYQDAAGEMWIGTYGAGLARLREGVVVGSVTRDSGLPSNTVWALLEDRGGSLWIGTNPGGVTRLRDGRMTTFGVAEGLPGDIVTALMEDRDGRLWIGTAAGVARLDDGAVTLVTAEDGLSSDNVTFLLEDRGGAVWVGTWGGLNRLDEGQVVRFTADDGLAHDSVMCLHEDQAGSLWVGSYGGGLSRIRNGEIGVVDRRHGLVDNVVYQILEDGAGWMWMSSNSGVFRVRRSDLDAVVEGRADAVVPQLFGRPDGLRNPECNGGTQNAALRTRDGRLWFATLGGAAVVDPSGLARQPHPPPVHVDTVIADGVELAPEPGATHEIVVPPGEVRLEFRLTAINLGAPERTRLRCWLEGLDEAWVDLGRRRVAYYTNVPPGRYRFRVGARAEGGPWGAEEAVVRLRLQPRFFQTVPFYLGLAAVALLAMVTALRLRERRLRARERDLSREVEERTASLREVTRELAASNRRLEQLAMQDGLTGIANRRLVDGSLEREWRRAQREGSAVSVVLVDIDLFKDFNDTRGHLAGDDCLRRIGELLAGLARRPGDLAARYGGEEFLLLLPGSDLDGAAEVAETARRRAEELAIPHPASTVADHLTVSAGVATAYPARGGTPENLLHLADEALYEAKKTGRNRVVRAAELGPS